MGRAGKIKGEFFNGLGRVGKNEMSSGRAGPGPKKIGQCTPLKGSFLHIFIKQAIHIPNLVFLKLLLFCLSAGPGPAPARSKEKEFWPERDIEILARARPGPARNELQNFGPANFFRFRSEPLGFK